MSGQTYRLGFRADVEGLRAVAILLVVAAHAGVTGFAGGFVGVDVFFVLSGYLITGLLVQEIHGTGQLRFARFYARRLRRLLPGLLLMLAVAGVLGWLLIPPAMQPVQGSAAASAVVWLSNFYFAFTNTGYFSPGAESNLFLHTWSLGVEEQFYLVWPLFLVLTAGAWRSNRASSGIKPARLKVAMWLMLVASLVGCIVCTYASRDFAFYMMPTRAWQFAVGALVFLYCGSPGVSSAGGVARARISAKTDGLDKYLAGGGLCWCGWLGLGLIVLSGMLLQPSVAYPGYWALLPCLGAAVVLAAGARGQRRGVSRLLGIRPLQFIGRISYSWYLWHWPVLLLGATVISTESWANRLALVVLSAVLAAGSYYFVETPIRRNGRLIIRPGVAIMAALAVMVVGNTLAISWNNAARQRVTQPEFVRYQQARFDAPVIYRMGCDDWYHSAAVQLCAFGPEDAAHVAVAIGDSVALQWFPAFAQVFRRPGWRLLVMTKSSCPMVDEPFFYARIGHIYAKCATWREDALAKIADIEPDIVILGSTYTADYTKTQWVEGTTRVLQSIAAAVGRVYVLRSTPTLPFNAPSCAMPRSWLYNVLSQRGECSAPAANARSDRVFAWRTAAAAPFANVAMLDMNDAVCPQGQCRAELHGMITFRDQQHLTATYARALAPVLEKRLHLGDLQH